MYDNYRSEMKSQGKNIKGLADFLGKTHTAVDKKLNGVNPWSLDEAYGAMDFIEKPYSEMPKYFPRKVVERC